MRGGGLGFVMSGEAVKRRGTRGGLGRDGIGWLLRVGSIPWITVFKEMDGWVLDL